MTAPLSGEALDALAAFDTPTICNALSALLPDGGRRNVTSEMLHCPFPAAILSLLRGEVPANVVNPAVPEHPAFRRRLERYRTAARQKKILFDSSAVLL